MFLQTRLGYDLLLYPYYSFPKSCVSAQDKKRGLDELHLLLGTHIPIVFHLLKEGQVIGLSIDLKRGFGHLEHFSVQSLGVAGHLPGLGQVKVHRLGCLFEEGGQTLECVEKGAGLFTVEESLELALSAVHTMEVHDRAAVGVLGA